MPGQERPSNVSSEDVCGSPELQAPDTWSLYSTSSGQSSTQTGSIVRSSPEFPRTTFDPTMDLQTNSSESPISPDPPYRNIERSINSGYIRTSVGSPRSPDLPPPYPNMDLPANSEYMRGSLSEYMRGSPILENGGIFHETLEDLSLQDSANNNVDENSNDQQYNEYPQYHQQFNQHHIATTQAEQSVRPRTPRPSTQSPLDESERASASPPSSGFTSRRHRTNNCHRRNLSEDLTLDRYDLSRHPPPQSSQSDFDRLPRLPCDINDGRSDQSWVPLSISRGLRPHPCPSSEDTRQQAHELLENFTMDAFHRQELDVPQDIFNAVGFSCPAWGRTGRELRELGDAFARTKERTRVRTMAETVNLSSINVDNFFALCSELFSGGITCERIVALFTFVADIAILHVRRHANNFLRQLMQWSLDFIVQHLCRWVQQAGGWGVVLSHGANVAYKIIMATVAGLGIVAFSLYIHKTLK